MFHEMSGDAVRELARTYIDPVGKTRGVKAFAKRIFPHKSDDQAYTRLMNCTNPDTKDQLTDEEWRAIIRIGHEQNKHCVAEYLVGDCYEVKPRLTEELRQKRKAYRCWLLEELRRTEDD